MRSSFSGSLSNAASSAYDGIFDVGRISSHRTTGGTYVSKEGLTKFTELLGTNESVVESLMKREKVGRIDDVIATAKESGLDVTKEEAEQLLGSIAGTRIQEAYIEAFGADVPFNTYRKLSRTIYP
jgi:hypothetical protein